MPTVRARPVPVPRRSPEPSRAHGARTPDPRRPDKACDGMLFGGDGRAWPPTTPLEKIPPVRPGDGRRARETILFVNGCFEPLEQKFLSDTVKRVADATGQDVVALYAATEGVVKDLVQAAQDTFDRGENPPVKTLARVLQRQLETGKPLRLMVHSQGALIFCRAVKRVREKLAAEGWSAARIEKRLGLLTVETLAGATGVYPDGPRYVHWVNRVDPFAMTVGLGRGLGTSPGKGAVVRTFVDLRDPHEVWTYFRSYVPAEQLLPQRR